MSENKKKHPVLEKGKKYFVCSNNNAFKGTFDKQVNNNGEEDFLLFDNIEDSAGFKYETHSMPVEFLNDAMVINSDSTQINNSTPTEPLLINSNSTQINNSTPTESLLINSTSTQINNLTPTETLEEIICKDSELLKLVDEYANLVNKILTVNGKFPSGNLPNILYKTIENINNDIIKNHNGKHPMINLPKYDILRGELLLPYIKYAIKNYYIKDNNKLQTNVKKIEECLVKLPEEYLLITQKNIYMSIINNKATEKKVFEKARNCFNTSLGFDSLFWGIIMEHFYRYPTYNSQLEFNDVKRLLTIDLNILKRIQFFLNTKTGGKKKKRRTIRHKRGYKKRYSRKQNI